MSGRDLNLSVVGERQTIDIASNAMKPDARVLEPRAQYFALCCRAGSRRRTDWADHVDYFVACVAA
jgi:hypothetical protein